MSEKKSIEQVLSQTLADAIFDVNTPAQSSDGMFDLPTLDDLARVTKPKDIPQKEERNMLRGLGEFATQFAQRGTETATLGVSKFAFGEAEEAETLGGKIGATLGTVAGFMAPMSAFGKVAKAGVRAGSSLSGTKLAERLRKPTIDALENNVKHIGKQRDSLAPLTQKQTSDMFNKEIVEKKLLNKIENFGSDRAFKAAVDRNKFNDDVMTYTGRFLEKEAAELGLQIGVKKYNPVTKRMENKVLDDLTTIYKKEWDNIGGRPITEFRQQLQRVIPFSQEGRISAGLATMLEEGIAFAAVEGGMHVTNVLGGFHQHDGTDANWDEIDDVLGQAFVLGNILGAGRFIPGGVKGGAIPNLFSQSGRAQGKALLGYLPKYANKYNPIGTDIAARTDRTSIYNMYRHFDKMKTADKGLQDVMLKGFDNHPLYSVLSTGNKPFVSSRANIREMLVYGSSKQQDALGQILKDNLNGIGNYAAKTWRKDFPNLLKKDIMGSQLRMGYGGMVLSGGPQLLFDENILFEDKMIGFLTGYFLFKHGKEITYKNHEPGEKMWGSWSGQKLEYGEQRAKLKEVSDMWEALGVDFGQGPWSRIIKRSREQEAFGDRIDVDMNTSSAAAIKDAIQPNLIERTASKNTSDSSKITKDKDYEYARLVHEDVIKHYENEGYIDSANNRIMSLEEMSFKQYKQTVQKYRDNRWERELDIKIAAMESKVNGYSNTNLGEVQPLIDTAALLQRADGTRYGQAITKPVDNAPAIDSQGIYQTTLLKKVKASEFMSSRESEAVDWYNKHIEHIELGTSSLKGGSKVKLDGEMKVRETDIGFDTFVTSIEQMKKNFEINYAKNLEVESSRQILYNNDMFRNVSGEFNYVLEANRLKKFMLDISNKNETNRSAREIEIIEGLKDLYSVSKKADINLYHSNTNEFTGFTKLNKSEQAFFKGMLPLVSRLGKTTETYSVKLNEKTPINKDKVKLLKGIFEAEGFNIISDRTEKGAMFKNDVADLLLREETKTFLMPEGKGYRVSTINDRAVISRVFASPLVKNRQSRMLRESMNIFDTIDLNNFGSWDSYVKSPEYNNLSTVERTNAIEFKKVMDAEGVNFNTLNQLNRFLEPYMLQEKGNITTGFFRKSQEIVEIPPVQYMELLQSLKYIQKQNIKDVEFPLFMKDLNQIARSEKSEFKSLAGKINSLITTASPKDQIHIYTLMKNQKMLNENNLFGFKKDMEIAEPLTSMENNYNILKENFGTRTAIENKDFNDYVNNKWLDGELQSELADTPARTVSRLFDKYEIGGKFSEELNVVQTIGDQLKSKYYTEYKQQNKTLYDFAKDLKQEIMSKNDVKVEDLDVEMVSMMKSVGRAQRVISIDVDANSRPSNVSDSSVANNKFYKTFKDLVGEEQLYIINENFIPLSQQKYADTRTMESSKALNEALGMDNFVIVNGDRLVKRRNNQSTTQLMKEMKADPSNENVNMLPAGTFVKWINGSGGAYFPSTSYNRLAQKYAEWTKKTNRNEADLKDLNVLRNEADNSWYYKDNKIPGENFKNINEMFMHLQYSPFMSKGQWKNIAESSDAALWKNLKYFVMFKNDNEFVASKPFVSDIKKLVANSSSTFGGRKNQLLMGLSANESTHKVFVLKDEVPMGEGYKGGDVPELFSNRARYEKQVESKYPELFETIEGEISMLSETKYKQLSKDKQELYDMVKEDYFSTDFKDKSWADGLTIENPDINLARAFINGVSPENISKVQGNKWMGKRYTKDNELEFVKSYGISMPELNTIFSKKLSDGTRIAQIETISGNKTIGKQSKRMQDNVLEITDWKEIQSLS